jgi:hypothetical protein
LILPVNTIVNVCGFIPGIWAGRLKGFGFFHIRACTIAWLDYLAPERYLEELNNSKGVARLQ